jgi:phage tail-like protein
MPIPIPQGEDPSIPFPGFAFHVHFAGLAALGSLKPEIAGGFSEVTGLEATMEPKAIKEGGRNYGPLQRPGPVSFATVILKRGVVESRHLWRWWSYFAGADGAENGGWAPSGRCDVSVALIRGRDPVLGWRLENAMPVKFRAGDLNARGTEVAIEELHLVHEGLHMLAVP